MPPASNVLAPLRSGPASSAALLEALQLPRPALCRVLRDLRRQGRVLQLGDSADARYALPRRIPGAGCSWPVFRVDTAGRVSSFGRLDALLPHHFHFETPHQALRGLTEGLPWFLNALRPSGFLGHARAHPSADAGDELPSAEDADIAWLVRHGFDGPGDLILGAEALEAWRSARQRLQVVDAGERARRYPLMAAAVLAGEGAGAQLGGETPKFTAITDHGGHLVPVLVKFSPPMDSPEGLRAGGAAAGRAPGACAAQAAWRAGSAFARVPLRRARLPRGRPLRPRGHAWAPCRGTAGRAGTARGRRPGRLGRGGWPAGRSRAAAQE